MEDITTPPVVYVPSLPLPEDNEIDFLAIWRTLWRWKWFIAGVTLACTLIAVYITLYKLPVVYRSEVVLQPTLSPETQSSLGTTLGQLGQFISLPPISGGDKSQLIVNYLKSRSLKTWMIKKFNLLPRLYPDKWNSEKGTWLAKDPKDIPSIVKAIQTRKMEHIYSVENDDKVGLISITFVDRDPAFTPKVLDGVTGELKRYLAYEYITDAKRKRIFIEQQVERAKREIEYWERQKPDADHSASEILREQQAALAAYTELRMQYELARVEEAGELIAFKVLDPPFVPEKKYKPRRTIICALTLVISLFLTIFMAFFFEFIKNARAKEAEAEPMLTEAPAENAT